MTQRKQPFGNLILLSLSGVLLAGCGTTQTDPSVPLSEAEENDPLEGFNRCMFAVNGFFDTFFLDPMVGAYESWTPDFFKQSVHDIVENYLSPISILNSTFQGDGEKMLVHTVRFLMNTVFGLGGLIDICSLAGMPAHPETFGDTLRSWGLGPGCFLVLPLLGPFCARDFFGQGIDWLAHPFDWYLMGSNFMVYCGEKGCEYVDARLKFKGVDEALHKSYADPYLIVRNAYYEKRGCKSEDKKIPRLSQNTGASGTAVAGGKGVVQPAAIQGSSNASSTVKPRAEPKATTFNPSEGRQMSSQSGTMVTTKKGG